MLRALGRIHNVPRFFKQALVNLEVSWNVSEISKTDYLGETLVEHGFNKQLNRVPV